LVAVGSYTIGKERMFTAIAEALDCRIWATSQKAKILKALGDKVIQSRLTETSSDAGVHVLEMKHVKNRREMEQYLELVGQGGRRFNHILTVTPTGWTHTRGASVESSLASLAIQTYGKVSSLSVPYSEHSSFGELRRFVKFLQLKNYRQVIPTVNVGSERERERMNVLFQDWIAQDSRPEKRGRAGNAPTN
jgi:DNA cross-link repair 1A protein